MSFEASGVGLVWNILSPSFISISWEKKLCVYSIFQYLPFQRLRVPPFSPFLSSKEVMREMCENICLSLSLEGKVEAGEEVWASESCGNGEVREFSYLFLGM